MHVAHLTPDPRSLSVAFGAPDERGTRGARGAGGRPRGADARRHSTDERRDGEGGTIEGVCHNCPLLGPAALGCQHRGF